MGNKLMAGAWILGVLFAGLSAFADEGEAKGLSAAFEEAWEKHQSGKSATAAFQKILDDESASEKDRFNSAYVLAVISIASKKPDEALAFLDRAEKILPERPQVAVRRAEVLTTRQDYRQAAKHLTAAGKKLRKKKKSDHYYRHQMVMARLEHATGAPKPAAARLEKLSRRFKNRWETHFRLGTLYEALDDPKRSLAHYERAIQLDPKQDPFPGIYAYQRWAALSISSNPGSYMKKDLVAQAIERYDRFLKRAQANQVPRDFVQKVTQARDTLQSFGAK